MDKICLYHRPAMEKEFVSWIEQQFQGPENPVLLGIGDDAAIVDFAGPVVITTDSIADGTHFDSEQHTLDQIGYKAIAVNVSDIAAMGAKPVAMTINLNLPQEFGLKESKALFSSLAQTAQRLDIQIIGGDTNRWPEKLVIGITLFGTKFPEAASGFWRISNAIAGDEIFVSGDLGGSIVAKHIEFEPRIDLARYLIENYAINACTDITDSLAIDLAAMARSSGLGFEIDHHAIPVSDDARRLSHDSGVSALEHALYDGEDFELLLSVSTDVADRLKSDSKIPVALSHVGMFTNSGEFNIVNDGVSTPLSIRGFEH